MKPDQSNGVKKVTLSRKWKNERPKNNEAYKPTDYEHLANIVTHGVRKRCVPRLF